MHTYLTFSGNCREAMRFYQECLGGKLVLQDLEGSPGTRRLPPRMKSRILHATLSGRDFLLMATDLVGDKGLKKGNAVALWLNCSTEKEARTRYAKLSEEGERTHPLAMTGDGGLMGDLTDKYGNPWLIHYQRTDQSNLKKTKR